MSYRCAIPATYNQSTDIRVQTRQFGRVRTRRDVPMLWPEIN